MDRRKDSLFWKTLNLVVNLIFLLLAVTIMTILLKNDNYRTDMSNYEIALSELRRDVNKVNQSNFVYLENKINAVATNQDSYQNNTTRRVDVLEERQKMVEEKRLERRNSIVNNNNNILSTPKN